MKKSKKLYIAYGSNMNIDQMSHRCPTAKVVAANWLEGYRLRFKGGTNGAVATVEPSPDDLVPILIWEITRRDEAALDIYEGYPRLYRKETLTVKLGRKKFPAMIYIMNGEQYPYGYPSKSHFNTIREGYIAAGFDPKLLHQAVAENMKGEFSTMMTNKIKEQILAIRDSGETNMLDTRAVQWIANREGYYELVVYLEEHSREYWNFIMTGEAPMEDDEDGED